MKVEHNEKVDVLICCYAEVMLTSDEVFEQSMGHSLSKTGVEPVSVQIIYRTFCIRNKIIIQLVQIFDLPYFLLDIHEKHCKQLCKCVQA